TSAWMVGGSTTFIFPFGPSKATAPAATEALVLPSSLIASFPIRLMSVHRADQLAADVLLAGLGVAEDALAGGEDADAQTAQHRPDVAHRDVAPQPRLADPPDAVDHRALVRAILQLDGDLPLGLEVVLDVVGDVAGIAEDPGHRHLHLAGGDHHPVVPRPRGIADAGQHVADGIVDWHVCSSFVLRPAAGLAGPSRLFVVRPRAAVPPARPGPIPGVDVRRVRALGRAVLTRSS